MSTVVQPSVSLRGSHVRPGASDRTFYVGIAVAMAATVFAGFARTYYLHLLSGTATTLSGAPLSPTVHLHGILFSAWVVLFVAQTALVSTRRVRAHRTLGYASIGLAAAMIVVGLRTALEAAARGAAPPGVDALGFLAVPFFDIVLFTGFYAAAILRRGDREAHKRFMLLAYASLITAAVARLPGISLLGLPAFFVLSFMFVVAAMVHDRLTRGRVHAAYRWGAPILAASVPLRLVIASTEAWRTLAGWVTR